MATMATMAGAGGPAGGSAGAYGAAPRAGPRPADRAEVERWRQRLKGAEKTRERWAEKVWRPLYRELVGSLVTMAGEPDASNLLGQFAEVIMPHLVGDNRQCVVRVNRISAREDPAAKFAFAELLGDQATALARNVGAYEDLLGRPGELAKALFDFLYACGVLVFGFNPPAGLKRLPPQPGQGESREGKLIDLDWAAAEHREQADAGMPWVRSYPPTQVLFDLSYRDVTQGEWFALECYHSVAECRALWGEKYRWNKTHDAVPAWDGSGARESAEPASEAEGLVKLCYIYERVPSRLRILPDEKSGVDEFVADEPLELGIEGLNLLVIGAKWSTQEPYPIPALAHGLGPSANENEFLKSYFAAAAKVKTGTVTKDPALAQQLREGEPHGVYTAKDSANLDDLFKDFAIGGVRSEHIEAARFAREHGERSLGIGDMQLGLREPGKRTVPEIQARQASISSRMAGLVRPVRAAEAAMHQRLIAIAYSKLDWLHGMLLPIGQGENTRWAVFDANRPMVGELLDYAFEIETSDELTDADEKQGYMELLQLGMQLEPLLHQRGMTFAADVAFTEIVRRTGLPRPEEMIQPLPPPPPQPEMMPPQGGPAEQSGGAGPPGGAAPTAPPQAPPPPSLPDPQQQLAELYALLEQIPEGDPAEEEILQQIAALAA